MPQPTVQPRRAIEPRQAAATADSQTGYGIAGGFGSTTADAGLFTDLIVVEYIFIQP